MLLDLLPLFDDRIPRTAVGGVFDTIPLITVHRERDEADDEEAVLLALL